MKYQSLSKVFRDCTAKVSANLLPDLQLVDGNITGVHFLQGHPYEIIEQLKLLSTGITTKTQRYPLVALFRDIPEIESPMPGIYAQATVNMIIATRTDPNYNADQREQKSFIPILHPIYNELKKQLDLSGEFMAPATSFKGCTRIDHYFWGRESIYGTEANIFTDWIDCIEIKNLNLKTYLTC